MAKLYYSPSFIVGIISPFVYYWRTKRVNWEEIVEAGHYCRGWRRVFVNVAVNSFCSRCSTLWVSDWKLPLIHPLLFSTFISWDYSIVIQPLIRFSNRVLGELRRFKRILQLMMKVTSKPEVAYEQSNIRWCNFKVMFQSCLFIQASYFCVVKFRSL